MLEPRISQNASLRSSQENYPLSEGVTSLKTPSKSDKGRAKHADENAVERRLAIGHRDTTTCTGTATDLPIARCSAVQLVEATGPRLGPQYIEVATSDYHLAWLNWR